MRRNGIREAKGKKMKYEKSGFNRSMKTVNFELKLINFMKSQVKVFKDLNGKVWSDA